MAGRFFGKTVALAILSTVLVAGCATTQPTISTKRTPTVAGDDGVVTTKQAEKLIARASSEAPDPAAFSDLLAGLGSLSQVPLYKDSHAELLVDGPATYAAMLEAIAGAQRYVHVETFIFADDEIGERFARALMERSQAGVNVRVIFDSIGSITSDDAFFASMKEAGVELIEFHDINPLDGGNPLNANVRDHRKLLIVDGLVAFTGGVNFSRTYTSSSSWRKHTDPDGDPLVDGWRDTHVAVRGPAANGLELLFEKNWSEQGGSFGEDVVAAPTPEKAGEDIIAIVHAEGGDDVESAIYHAYLEAMKIAEERIWITQAYFAPDKEFLQHLKDAAQRGVDVRVLVPGVSDSALLLNASRSRYGGLLSKNVRIYETTSSVLHAKTAVIDSLWSTVGSANLDNRSFLHNDEVNAIIIGSDFARQMEELFAADLQDARAVTLEEWKNRSLFDRLKEFVAWPLEYWL